VYGKGANPPKSISAPEARLQAAGTGSPGGDSTRVWRRVSAPAPARPKRSHRPRRRPKGFLGGRQISCPEDPCEKSSPEPTRASGDKLSCCRHVRGPFSPLRAGSFAPGVSGPLILFIFQLPTPGPWAGNRGDVVSLHRVREGCKHRKHRLRPPKRGFGRQKRALRRGDTTRFYRVPTTQAPVRPVIATPVIALHI
jgi:hypothetical protein